MRRSELVDITWEQVDLSNGTIRIIGKGKKEHLPLYSPLYCLYFNPIWILYKPINFMTLSQFF
ncbi:hypothetical protein [Cytobacillus depressus]|uniref:hypothetical protein n=1 Tax=Cytobacillus depressus TaxID=1602942 RepID=UPI001FECB859|nr:hypothetical protein [Cytobacillus depressus]